MAAIATFMKQSEQFAQVSSASGSGTGQHRAPLPTYVLQEGFSVLGNAQDAEDAVQDALLSAYSI